MLRAAGSRTLLLSLVKDWPDHAAMLQMEMFMLEAAVQAVQRKISPRSCNAKSEY